MISAEDQLGDQSVSKDKDGFISRWDFFKAVPQPDLRNTFNLYSVAIRSLGIPWDLGFVPPNT